MTTIKQCTECGKGKPTKEFVVEDGKRSSICSECATGISQEFLNEIDEMDDFTPASELEFPDDT